MTEIMQSRPVPDDWQRNATLFLVCQNLSLFGSSVVGFAIIWHITLTTTSGIWMTLAILTYTVPGVLISLWGGVWADRYSRKRLIMLADAAVALATLAVAVAFWLGRDDLELLLAAAICRSLGGGVQAPAVNAVYPQLVPAEKLTRVQGINQTLNAILMLMSPVVGGLVLGWMGLVAAFMIDVITAALAIGVMAFIPLPQPRTQAGDSIFAEMKTGLGYTFGQPRLKRLIISYAAFFFLVGPAGALTPLMVARSFGPEVWRLTANELVWSAASVLGGIFVARHGDFIDKPRGLALCLAAFGLCFGFLGLAVHFALYLALMGLAGFFMPIFVTLETVFIQEVADPALLGRVFSIVQLLSSGAMPLGMLLFGPLSDRISVESLLMATGTLMVLVGFLYHRAERRDAPASAL